MKKINKIFNIITVYMITMLVIAISVTYLSEHLNSIGWFGDYISKPTEWHPDGEGCWGSRHYFYVIFNVLMFIMSTLRLGISLNHISKTKL